MLLRRLAASLCSLLFVLTLSAQDSLRRVRLETTAGTIVVQLFNETPYHRDNFLRLVSEGYYDGLLFHRVIRDFMIQSGDPDSRTAAPGQPLGEGGPTYTLPLEVTVPLHYHRRGALAAAREPDDVNPERRSHASQFYIVYGQLNTEATLDKIEDRINQTLPDSVHFTDEMRQVYHFEGGTPHLDWQYTVFGEVIEGMDVVEAIQAVETDKNDRPLTDVRILRATVVKE